VRPSRLEPVQPGEFPKEEHSARALGRIIGPYRATAAAGPPMNSPGDNAMPSLDRLHCRSLSGADASLISTSRRRVLQWGTALSAGAVLPQAGAAAPVFDLVIRGGEMLDPSVSLRGVMDVGIRHGAIAALGVDLPAATGTPVIDAHGRLVVPGLVDLHAHVYPQGSAIGLPADELAPLTGTTTCVSAGDAGANNFSAFRHFIAAPSRTRLFAFLHISTIGLAGFPVHEMLNLDYADVGLAAKTVAENRDIVLGLKVRESQSVVGSNGLEPLRRAIKAAEESGTGARVMCHIGDAPGELSALLDMLRPGDILTHAYSGAGNNTVQNGVVLPAALAARARGVIVDVGHGAGSFDFTVAERALDQGFGPDTISSDIHALSGNAPSEPFLPNVMSKFLALGMSLEAVIAAATVRPAQVIDRVPLLGTLQVGAPADVTILDVVRKPVEFIDTRRNRRRGEQQLKVVQTVRAGRPFGRPYPLPFSYP